MSRLISPGYRALIRELHAHRAWGDGGHKYASEVLSLAHKFGAVTILDYGCGYGTLRPWLPRFDVREYDPGIVGKDALPSLADLVVCTDVLEHVEPQCLDAVLTHIHSLTRMACFAVISTRLAHTTLSDGSNAHRIVQSVKWWIEQLRTKAWTAELIERLDDDHLTVLMVRNELTQDGIWR